MKIKIENSWATNYVTSIFVFNLFYYPDYKGFEVCLFNFWLIVHTGK